MLSERDRDRGQPGRGRHRGGQQHTWTKLHAAGEFGVDTALPCTIESLQTSCVEYGSDVDPAGQLPGVDPFRPCRAPYHADLVNGRPISFNCRSNAEVRGAAARPRRHHCYIFPFHHLRGVTSTPRLRDLCGSGNSFHGRAVPESGCRDIRPGSGAARLQDTGGQHWLPGAAKVDRHAAPALRRLWRYRQIAPPAWRSSYLPGNLHQQMSGINDARGAAFWRSREGEASSAARFKHSGSHAESASSR